MMRTCDAEDWELSGKTHVKSLAGKEPCGLTYDDVDHSTICPHEELPPQLSLDQLQETWDMIQRLKG